MAKQSAGCFRLQLQLQFQLQLSIHCQLSLNEVSSTLSASPAGYSGCMEWLSGWSERVVGRVVGRGAGWGLPPTLDGLGISLAHIHTCWYFLHSLRVYLNFFRLPFQSSTPVPHSHCPPGCPLVRPSDYFRCLNKFANGFGLFELRFGAASR